MRKTDGMTDTALVLGSGGVTGSAWETGILHGLAKAGVDLGAADLIIGSSAGAVVGAQLASGLLGLPGLYELQLADPQDLTGGRLGPAMLLRYTAAVLSARTPRPTAGSWAGSRRTPDPASPGSNGARRSRSRLLSPEWPERPLLVTAVDATTGELRTFDKDSGVSLADAVTASCAVPGVWPVARIEGRTWIDGGVHSTANAQLAAGYGRVVVIAPSAAWQPGHRRTARAGGRTRRERCPGRGHHPGPGREEGLRPQPLDPSRAAAARAGLDQSAAHTEAVAAVLSS